MTKKTFKVGDRVRCNDTFEPAYVRGMETVITKDNGTFYMIADTKDPVTGDWAAEPHELDLIVEEPAAPKASKPKATNTKIAKVRAHFLSGKSLTQLEALGLYGAFRLAARVFELKAEGMKIDTFIKEDPNGNPYAEYKLRSAKVR